MFVDGHLKMKHLQSSMIEIVNMNSVTTATQLQTVMMDRPGLKSTWSSGYFFQFIQTKKSQHIRMVSSGLLFLRNT